MAVLSPELRAEAERVKARYPQRRARSAILPLLYLVQAVEGYVSRDGLREVAELLGTTTAEVEAVATFYTMLRLRPTGTHLISICTNLPCSLRGARDVYDAARAATGVGDGNVSEDGLFSIHEEECLGACDAAPVVQVDFANHDRVTVERMRELVDRLRAGEVPAPARGSGPADLREASRILAGIGGPASRLAAAVEKEGPPEPTATSAPEEEAEPQPGPTRQEARGAEPGKLGTGERPS